MTRVDTSCDLFFDMIIPCFLIQNQNFNAFSIEMAQCIYGFSIHFLLILLFKLLECDMIGDFNGTVSNMNKQLLLNLVPLSKSK